MRRLERFLAAVAILVTMAFSVISAETRIVTNTLVDEAFSMGNVSVNKYTSYSSMVPWQPNGTSNIDLGAMFMCVQGAPDQYGYFDFGYGYSKVEDNWTVEFDLEMPYISYAKGQVAVTGENSSVTSGTYISDVYLSFISKYTEQDQGSVSNSDDLRLHRVIVCGEELDELVLIRSLLHVKMECVKANTSSAELTITLNCADFSNRVIKKIVDVQTLGKPRGFYCYTPMIPGGQYPKQFLFDNIKLTTQSAVEYEACAAPTFEVTAASGKSRTVAISCATEGAQIYYSSTPLNIGDEGWIEYDGEITSEYKTLYAYAVNPVFEDTTEVVSFETGAGSQPKFKPLIVKLGYELGKGYRFTIDPNLASVGVLPPEYTWLYSVTGENGEQMEYTPGDTLYVAEGNTVWTQMTADGYTRGRDTWQTVAYPKLSTVWSEDLIGKIDVASMGTSQMPLTLNSEPSFVMEDFYKSFYSIAKVGNTDISIDSRITLTTDSVFFMQKEDNQKGGLLSLKHNIPELDYDNMTEDELENSDELYYSRYEGMGIKGLAEGQYVFVRTNGMEPELVSANAELVEGVSTINEYIYQMYEDGDLYLFLPYGTYVKSIDVRSDKEMIETNDYGYAVLIPGNPLDFSEMPEEFEALVVSEEPTSGEFVYDTVVDAPAGEVLIVKGEPNTVYSMPMLPSSEAQSNLLTYSETAVDVSNEAKPVYVLDLTDGKMKKVEDKTQPIPAFTPYIISALDETVYRYYTMSQSGRLSIYSNAPLDFSGVEGLKAYALEYETPDSVHLKAITQLVANKGAILEGTPGATYKVPEVTTVIETSDNFFIGSETEDFPTTSTDKIVYALNTATGKVEVIDKSLVPTIPAGEAYYITKYIGFEVVRTNAAGALTHITSNALDFSEIELRAYIVTGEQDKDTPIISPVSAVPAGTAILIKNGKSNYEYRIPYYNKSAEITIGTNRLTSQAEDFDVSNENHYVYGLLENGDQLVHVDQSAVIPAGTAYMISDYELPVVIESVDIEMPSSGMRSFVTDKALDFTGLDALEVLICDTVELEGPLFKRVYEVPAKTAFFVKGVAGTYKVPVGTCESLPYKNLIEGSNEKGFYTGRVNTYVYIVMPNGEVDVVSNNTSLASGVGYIISPWKGFETITTSASGATTYVTKGPLDFSGLKGELMAFVVDYETVTQIHTVSVEQVPAGEPIILQGAPNTTYKVPTGNCLELSRKNLLEGSWDKEFAVADTANIVYVVSGGVFKIAAQSKVMAKGKAYFVSKYRGFEKVTTSESAHTSYVCEHALDLTDVYDEVVAYIAIRERPIDFDLERITKIPAGTAFFVKSVKGEKNKTYSLPYANEEITELPSGTITRGSRTEEHLASDFGDSTVYVLSDGEFKKAEKSMVLKAGKAYIVSKYLGYDFITTSESGFTTYVSDKPLDIRDYDGEVRMFIVEEETEDSIYTKEVFEVPSNTPFIFQGAAEKKDTTYKIPWGNCQSLPCDNLLRGSLTEEFYCNSVGDTLVYVVSGGKFMVASRDKVMEPRKAYLVSKFLRSDSNNAKATSFELEEGATAIGDIQDEQKKQRAPRRVNLAGQEVDDTYKGIVIDEKGRKYLQR